MDEDAMFDQLDTDGNGVIDEAELGAALKAMGAPIEVGQLFQMLDKNNDGSIDRNEFHAFYEMFSGGGEDDDVDDMEEFDEEPVVPTTTGTGMGGASGAAAEISEEDVVQEIMDDLDDGSGTVAADEVAGLSTNFFGIDRADFIQLLHSNNYTEKSKLNRKDVQNIVALCKSLAKLDEDIDLDGETDDEEQQDDALGMEFDRVSLGSDEGNRLQDFEDADEDDNVRCRRRLVALHNALCGWCMLLCRCAPELPLCSSYARLLNELFDVAAAVALQTHPFLPHAYTHTRIHTCPLL